MTEIPGSRSVEDFVRMCIAEHKAEMARTEAQRRKAHKLQALIADGSGATEGEREAARAALARLTD